MNRKISLLTHFVCYTQYSIFTKQNLSTKPFYYHHLSPFVAYHVSVVGCTADQRPPQPAHVSRNCPLRTLRVHTIKVMMHSPVLMALIVYYTVRQSYVPGSTEARHYTSTLNPPYVTMVNMVLTCTETHNARSRARGPCTCLMYNVCMHIHVCVSPRILSYGRIRVTGTLRDGGARIREG